MPPDGDAGTGSAAGSEDSAAARSVIATIYQTERGRAKLWRR
jgi:hypothetical protein